MKLNSIILIFFILSAYTTCAQDSTGINQSKDGNERVGSEKSVVFIGNSITQAWIRMDSAFFTHQAYLNKGISGQVSKQILGRFRSDVILLRPAVVVILAGTNDIATNQRPDVLDSIMHNITAMAEMARANGIKVVLSSVLPVYDYPWRKGVQPAPKIIKLNDMIRQYADQNGMVYLDYFSSMADERDGLKAAYTNDGVHPNLAGYKVMEPLAQEAISKALSQK